MKHVRHSLGTLGALLALLAFAPIAAHAHEGEVHGVEPPAAAATATTAAPETQFELEILDTSGNDPLLGSEAPLEGAKVTATVTRGGKTVLSQEAHKEDGPGVYGVHGVLQENGAHTLTWQVQPAQGEPFQVEFPLLIAGAPEQAAPFFSGWRIPAAVGAGLLSLIAVFLLGRASGNGHGNGHGNGNGHGAAGTAAVLVFVSLTAWIAPAGAHEGEDHSGGAEKAASTAAAAAGPGADLKVGIGNLATVTQTKKAGKYQATLTVKVVKPTPPDPNQVSLTAGQAKTLGIQTVAVKAGTFATGLAVTGAVQPNPASTVTLSSRVSGKLRSVSAGIGERVRAGQTLAIVESSEIAEAQGAYSAAQSEVLARQAALSQAQGRIRIAERQLAQQQELAAAGAFAQGPLQQALTEQATVASELATTRAEVAEANSTLAQARADLATHTKALQRIQELFEAGIRSRAELEAQELEVTQDKAKVTQAEALVQQQQARVRQAQRRVSLTAQAVAREQRIRRSNVLTRRELTEARGALDTARLEARQAEAGLSGARRAVQAARARLSAVGATPGSGNAVALTAPIDAVVTEREAAVGETVSPDKTLFTLLNPSIVVVEGDLFAQDLPLVRVGLPARITTDAVPGRTFTGRISSIGSTVDPETRAVRARVAISNPGGLLRPGTFVRALLVTKARGGTVTVPDAAIQEDGGLKVVFVKEGGSFRRREVAVGESVGGRTEIKSGIKPGEQVVTTGAYQLKSVGKS